MLVLENGDLDPVAVKEPLKLRGRPSRSRDSRGCSVHT